MSVEKTRFEAFNEIQEQCMAALARGEMKVTMTLEALAWIDIIQELKDRNPRNFSSLLRDKTMERMEAAIERLHEEVTYLVVSQPGAVAKRTDPKREAPVRSAVSSRLQQQLRNPKP